MKSGILAASVPAPIMGSIAFTAVSLDEDWPAGPEGFLDRLRQPGLVVVCQPAPYRVVLGEAVVRYDWSKTPERLQPALVLPPLTQQQLLQAKRLDNLDRPTWSQLLFGIEILSNSGMTLRVIASALPPSLPRSISELSRLLALRTAPPELLAAVDKGHLPWKSIRFVLNESADVQRKLAAEAGSAPLTVAQVREFTTASFDAPVATHKDPNAQRFVSDLSETLNTEVSLQGASGETEITLVLQWYSVPELLGMFELLGAGNPDPDALPFNPRPRKLTIKLDSIDELNALTEHLIPKQ